MATDFGIKIHRGQLPLMRRMCRQVADVPPGEGFSFTFLLAVWLTPSPLMGRMCRHTIAAAGGWAALVCKSRLRPDFFAHLVYGGGRRFSLWFPAHGVSGVNIWRSAGSAQDYSRDTRVWAYVPAGFPLSVCLGPFSPGIRHRGRWY